MQTDSVRSWLTRRAELSPQQIALYDAERHLAPLTYGDWHQQVAQTAGLLRRLGVSAGDRVAALSFNCIDLLDLWFACGTLGAIFHPLNWRLTVADLCALLDDSQPCLLAYGREWRDSAARLFSSCSSLRGGLAIDGAAALTPAHVAIAERQRESAAFPAVSVSDQTPWLLCNTGGSTGLPKAAVLTHGSVAANALNTIVSWGLRADDTAILNAPLFHTGGLNVFTAPLVMAGGASIVCRSFDAGQVLTLITHSPATLFFGVPTMFHALQQHPAWPTTDFSRMRIIIAGGAACPDPIRAAFAQRDLTFKTGYGLTEAGPNTFWLPDEQLAAKPGAVGYPLWDVATRIVDDDGRDLPPDSVGELLIRGPHVCAGYWQRPAESTAMLRDGWLATGDLARRDADGCHWIVGRRKEMFISGGENIYPAEIENVIAGHPAVAEVAVIGLPDVRWGEVGCAAVVARPTAELSVAALAAFVAERLPRYKQPRRWRLLPALPRTGAGKVDRPALTQVLLAAEDSAASA
jgi:fatty-acyl-CoA synthase